MDVFSENGFKRLCVGEDFSISKVDSGIKSGHPKIMDKYRCIICHSGSSKGSVNLRQVDLRKCQIAVNVPSQVLQHFYASEDYYATVIELSQNFVSSLGFPYNFQIIKSISENPVLVLKDTQYQSILSYCDMVTRILSEDRLYRMEMLRHLTCAFLYGLADCVVSQASHTIPSADDVLMQRFIREVESNFKHSRAAGEYAERLHVSHPYLASVVKKVSQRTVSMWIADFVILEAKALLYTTNMTIQQISDSLNFPNQSFFGKYFKKHTGMSPKAYRCSLAGIAEE